MLQVCFYRGSGLSALAVRMDTRRPEQSSSDVPAHCAVSINGILYEMISGGWHARYTTADDLAWSVEVSVQETIAFRAAESWRGAHYGWWVIMLIAIARFFPNRYLSRTRGAQKHICSAFVKSVLEQGGWDCPHWLSEQYAPESPNDLWFALKTNLHC